MTETLYDVSRPAAVKVSERPLSARDAAAREKAEAAALDREAAEAGIQYRRDRAAAYTEQLG